jgi:molybdenum-dependent DNA-binding transcriptional regulator ModE
MTQPRTRRPNDRHHWTRTKALAFLYALSHGRSVAAAAREVGMSRQSAYRLRTRLGEGFAEVWDEALQLGRRHKVTLGGR